MKLRKITQLAAALLTLAALLAPGGALAAANHPFLGAITELAGGYEDACGVALAGSSLYVSDYYHDAIDLPGGGQITPASPDDGPCKLGLDPAGDLYVNDWHRDVVKYGSGELEAGAGEVIDSGAPSDTEQPTGLAVDPASGDLYVAHRTYVARYEAPVHAGETPAIIGEDEGAAYYGVAVSAYPATAGDTYLPDAATHTVKVFGSTGTLVEEIDGSATPQGTFKYLIDSEAVIDNNAASPSYGHLYLLDAIGHAKSEHPEAVLDEFNSAGAYRGQIAGFTDAEPSGVAIEATTGNVYVTSGNSEGSAVFKYGPTAAARSLRVTKTGAGNGAVSSSAAGIACGGACTAEFDEGKQLTLFAAPEPGSAFAGWSVSGPGAEPCPGLGSCTLLMSANREVTASFEAAPAPLAPAPGGEGAATSAAIAGPPAPPPATTAPAARRSAGAHASKALAQKGNLRIAVDGKLSPKTLPRSGTAPVSVSVSGKVSTTDESAPPQLQKLEIEINRYGRIETAGLPVCDAKAIGVASNGRALAACGPALVGEGKFFGTITLPGSEPYAIEGKLLVFNATQHGKPVLLGHIYSPHPFATSFVIAFAIKTGGKGTYGTTLTADLTKALGTQRNLTGIEMTLKRTYSYKGKRHSYISAGCPAPKGFPGASFPLARTSFGFADNTKLTSTLTRECKARG